jgi:hypothetical protein
MLICCDPWLFVIALSILDWIRKLAGIFSFPSLDRWVFSTVQYSLVKFFRRLCYPYAILELTSHETFALILAPFVDIENAVMSSLELSLHLSQKFCSISTTLWSCSVQRAVSDSFGSIGHAYCALKLSDRRQSYDLILSDDCFFPNSSYTSSSIPLRSHHFVRFPFFLQTSCINEAGQEPEL